MPWATTTTKSEANAARGPHSLYMPDVLAALRLRVPGLSWDRGGRLNIAHPYMGTRQGIFFGERHICSADRGWSPMWPVFSTKEEMVQVPLDYAMRHEDFPVLDIAPGLAGPEGFDPDRWGGEGATAQVLKPMLDDIEFIGWGEVLWKILEKRIPDISAQWWANEFKVPVDWLKTMRVCPVAEAFVQAREQVGG